MLIQPDSIIRLIRGCHIDNSYKDTIYFASREEQKEYFYNTLRGVTFTKQSYQRYADGVLHIQAKADDIYDCNYLMFQNTAFGNKWFYAFVNKIEYVNNVSSKVYYEIDVIQTWLLGLDIHPCFVERTHTRTDKIGDNIVPENLEIGEYYCNAQETWPRLTNTGTEYTAVIEYQGVSDNFDQIIEQVSYIKPGIYSKNYVNSNYFYVPLGFEDSVPLLTDVLDTLQISTLGGIVGVYILPTEAVLKFNEGFTAEEIQTQGYRVGTIGIQLVPSDGLEGYIPKNNKLFTYPYYCVNVRGDTDSGKNFAFESFFFEQNEGQPIALFDIFCPLSSGATVLACPRFYLDNTYPAQYSVQTSPYPSCKYTPDKIYEWATSTGLNLIASTLMSLSAGVAMSVDVAGKKKEKMPTALVTQPTNDNMPLILGNNGDKGIKDLGSLNTKINSCLGSLSGSNIVSNGGGESVFATPNGGKIVFSIQSVRKYAAEIIDSYFTMYGYAINELQIPSFNNRNKFTYIKTQGFSAHGAAPSSVLSKIGEIHDNGITYWKKDSVIGDYLQENKPIEEVESNE